MAKAVNTVCAMGDGNSLSLGVYLPLNSTIEYNGNLTLGNSTYETYCGFNELTLPSGKHTLAIENNGGVIRLQGV